MPVRLAGPRKQHNKTITGLSDVTGKKLFGGKTVTGTPTDDNPP